MRVIPALDLIQEQVVRLETGDFGRVTHYPVDAVETARIYARAGVDRLHVVDLDAARSQGSSRRAVAAILDAVAMEVQVAGGIRTQDDAEAWLALGAAAVVMGTTAVRDPGLLAHVAEAHPGRVFAALDLKAGRPAVGGWLETAAMSLDDVLETWQEAPLAGVILTSVDRDGTLLGPDLGALKEAVFASRHGVTYSGGIATLGQIREVAAAGAAGIILGKSLLEGRFSLADALSY